MRAYVVCASDKEEGGGWETRVRRGWEENKNPTKYVGKKENEDLSLLGRMLTLASAEAAH